MDNNAIYKLQQIVRNIDNLINELENFSRNCSTALLINDNTGYKDSIVNIKYSVYNQKYKINNEIIPEIKSKL